MTRTLYSHFEEIIGGALLVAMSVIGAIQVVSRYVMTSPLAWTEELATLLFAWLVFVGASLALKKNEHFAIDVVVKLLPVGTQKQAQMVRHVAVLVFCLLLIGFGVRLVVMNWYVRTPMLEISRGWIYLSLPCGALLMLARTVERMCGKGDGVEKGSGVFCRDGPPGASHKKLPTPFPRATPSPRDPSSTDREGGE